VAATAAVTAGVVTAAAQRAPDQQRQQQAEDADQHHDDADDVHIQAVDERCGDSKPQDRPSRDQSDTDASAHQLPVVRELDAAGSVHRRAVWWPTWRRPVE
jgi:hypothetical protein